MLNLIVAYVDTYFINYGHATIELYKALRRTIKYDKEGHICVNVNDGIVVLTGCDVSHNVEHFKGALGVMNKNDEFEVVYRITFPELTEYRYTKHQDVRNLRYYDTHSVSIM